MSGKIQQDIKLNMKQPQQQNTSSVSFDVKMNCIFAEDVPFDFVRTNEHAECSTLFGESEDIKSIDEFLIARSAGEATNLLPKEKIYFKNASVEEKYEILAIELAKNKFLHAEGTNYDEQVEKWNNLSDKQKNELINKAKQNFLDKKIEGINEHEKKIALSILYLDVQTANYTEMSYAQFDKLNDMKKESHKYNYLNSMKNRCPEALTEHNKDFLQQVEIGSQVITSYIDDCTDPEEKARLSEYRNCTSVEEIQDFYEKSGKNEMELTLAYLQKKEKAGTLTKVEEKQLKFLKDYGEFFLGTIERPDTETNAYYTILDSSLGDKYLREGNPSLRANLLYKHILESNPNKDDVNNLSHQVDQAIRAAFANGDYVLAQKLYAIHSKRHPNWKETITSNVTMGMAASNNKDGVYTTGQSASFNEFATGSGNENWIKSATASTGERDDALEVFKLANKLIGESNDISDDAKELYARYSVESLSTPEARDIQAKDLQSYDLDSFNNGVATGYKNIANKQNTTSASETKSTNAGDSTSSSYHTNPISYKAPDVKQQASQVSASVQNSKEYIEQLNLDNETDSQKLVDILSKDSSVLGKLDPQKREAVLKVYCKQADGARLFELFKKNPSASLCSILLHYSFAKINIYKDEMFKILINKSGNNMEKYAKELGINLETFANHNTEYAIKIAVATKNDDLSQKIMDNGAFYGLQQGSSEHFELIRIINSKKKVENGALAQSNFSNEEVPPRLLGLG